MSVVVQSNYRPQIAPAVAGMIADEASWDATTRICETAAGIGFGLAVSVGTLSDKGAVLGGTSFIGITIRDITLDRIPIDPDAATDYATADTYPKLANMGVLTRGTIWVVAMADVKSGDPVYYSSADGTFSNSNTGNFANGAIMFSEQPDAGDSVTIDGTKTVFVPQGTALTLEASAATTTSSPTLTFDAVPDWIVAGLPAYDVTSGEPVGTVQSAGGTTVTLAANASHAVAAGDMISFGGSNLGPTLGDTISALATMLNASADANLSLMKYAAYPPSPGGAGEGSGANTLLVASKTAGTGGNAYTLATDVTGATVSGSTLTGGTSSNSQGPVSGAYWKSSALSGQLAKLSLAIQR